jgi:hypothetical protein
LENLEEKLAIQTAAEIATKYPDATVLVMIGRNTRPHSTHGVGWVGSCMEVRGLLVQCSEIVTDRLNGTKETR